MINEKGEPAFPLVGDYRYPSENGMSLRDYFAAKAMAAIITADTQWSIPRGDCAAMAYDQADAMLKVREL